MQEYKGNAIYNYILNRKYSYFLLCEKQLGFNLWKCMLHA